MWEKLILDCDFKSDELIVFSQYAILDCVTCFFRKDLNALMRFSIIRTYLPLFTDA